MSYARYMMIRRLRTLISPSPCSASMVIHSSILVSESAVEFAARIQRTLLHLSRLSKDSQASSGIDPIPITNRIDLEQSGFAIYRPLLDTGTSQLWRCAKAHIPDQNLAQLTRHLLINVLLGSRQLDIHVAVDADQSALVLCLTPLQAHRDLLIDPNHAVSKYTRALIASSSAKLSLACITHARGSLVCIL